MRSKLFIISLFLLAAISLLQAQSDMLLYGLRRVPQSNFGNPAFIPEANTVVGVPIISSISNSVYSSSFSFNDIFVEKAGSDSLYLNLNKITNSSSDNNYVTEYFENDLLYLGFKINRSFLNIGIRNRLYSRAIYATDLVKLAWDGNANYIGEELQLNSTFINHDHFISYYAAFAFAIGNNVNLGVRASLNQGLSSIQTEKNQIVMETANHQENVYSLNANTAFVINTSGLNSDSAKEDFSATDYALNFQNLGFSIDFGGDFKLSERIKLNFSVLDLGFTNWKSNLKTYESTDTNVHFSGIYADISTTEDLFQAYGDSLAELIQINEFEKEYKTQLPTRIFFGFEYYSMDQSNRLSLVFSGTFLKNNFSPAFSVAYDKSVSRHFAFKISYSYLQYAPLNLGLGLVLNLRPVQFYVLTDNVFGAINWSGQRYLNIHFGINLAFTEQSRIKKGEPVFRR
jgi:hypothetical protein